MNPVKFIFMILNIFDNETPTAAEKSFRGVPRARLLLQSLAATLVRPLLLFLFLVFDGLGHVGDFGLVHGLRVRVLIVHLARCDGQMLPLYTVTGAAVNPS